jgi:hypothetical protein
VAGHIYNFGTCGFLLEAPPHLDVSLFRVTEIHNTDDLRELVRRRNWDGSLKTVLRPNEFRRMLAKIAHSWLTAIAGHGSFTPLALDAILKEDFNLSYLIGQNEPIEPVVQFGPNFSLRLRTMHHSDRLQSIMVIEIRLFDGMQTPTYHVVTGKTHSPEQYVIELLECLLRSKTLSPEIQMRLALEQPLPDEYMMNSPGFRLLRSLEDVRDACEAAEANQPSEDPVRQWCATTAFTLMHRFSKKEIVSGSPRSPYRALAGLLFEVVTGERGRDLKRACNDHLKAMRPLITSG